jgi:hypothetical protein
VTPSTGDGVRVRVVGDPGGDPPKWIRDAWFGVELDAIHGRRILVGSIRRPWWRPRMRRTAWVVVGTEAVRALTDSGQHDAAAWWNGRSPHGPPRLLVFREDSCEPVDAS